MSASNRAEIVNKIHRVLKKHGKPYAPPAERPVLEHLLYACCLENAKHESADEAFAKLQQMYFDWNEVRVTSTTELAETMTALPDPNDAASRLKRCLQSVFEANYSFDMEAIKKQNIGKTQADLEKYVGMTPFVIAYLTQNALGGHAIPVNRGVLELLQVLEVVSAKDAASGHVPGLERTIPKNKGVEFASLLHDFGVDFALSMNSTKVKTILAEIDPTAKDRLPKRTGKREDERGTEASKKTAAAPPKKEKREEPRDEKREDKRDEKREEKRDEKREDKSASKKVAKATSTKRLTKKKPR